MGSARHFSDETLLDYVLERCDRAEAADVAAAVGADPQVAVRLDRLRATLAPLDTWTTPPPPASMVTDILDRIAVHEAGAALRREQPGHELPSGDRAGAGGGRVFSLREALALAACIAILVSLLVPSVSAVRHGARRQRCASHLGDLGRAAAAYASANQGFLPYAGHLRGAWLRQPGQPQTSNTRHMYPLVKLGYVSAPKVLICPGRRDDTPMQADEVDRYNGFPNPRNRSYHQQFMARPLAVRAVVRPFVMPYVSDANPIFEGDTFNEDVDPATANSTSHGGQGQNVLFFDGSTRWCWTPIVQQSGDNMWQIGNLRRYSGSEVPIAATDVFMAP